MTTFPPTLERDILRALQFCYYVENESLVSDYHFDMMEKAYELESGRELPVGSTIAREYSERERALALYLQIAITRRF